MNDYENVEQNSIEESQNLQDLQAVNSVSDLPDLSEINDLKNDESEIPLAPLLGQDVNVKSVDLKRVLEALIFVSGKPLSLNEMMEVLLSQSQSQNFPTPDKEALENALNDLIDEWNDRNAAMYLMRVAQGYEFRTRSNFAPFIQKLNGQKPQKLSTSALEVLAIIAYRQPLTRAEIDDIRGVDSGGVLKSLLERRMIRLVGRKEEPGRPMLYGTSKDFLEIFSLKDLGDLPPLRDFEEMVRRQAEEARVAQSTSVVLDDLLSSTEEILALEDGERELLDELDDGMKNLKNVEKTILEQ